MGSFGGTFILAFCSTSVQFPECVGENIAVGKETIGSAAARHPKQTEAGHRGLATAGKGELLLGTRPVVTIGSRRSVARAALIGVRSRDSGSGTRGHRRRRC